MSPPGNFSANLFSFAVSAAWPCKALLLLKQLFQELLRFWSLLRIATQEPLHGIAHFGRVEVLTDLADRFARLLGGGNPLKVGLEGEPLPRAGDVHGNFEARDPDDGAFAGGRFGELEAHGKVGAALDEVAAAAAGNPHIRTDETQIAGLGHAVADLEGSGQLAKRRLVLGCHLQPIEVGLLDGAQNLAHIDTGELAIANRELRLATERLNDLALARAFPRQAQRHFAAPRQPLEAERILEERAVGDVVEDKFGCGGGLGAGSIEGQNAAPAAAIEQGVLER